MSGICYFIVDTETTGFSPAMHEVVDYSVIRCSDRNQLTRNIKAEHPESASPESLKITGKTYKDLLRGISKEQAVEDLINFLLSDGNNPESKCIVAHNASFDRGMLHALFRKVGRDFPAHLWLDTKTLTKNWLKKTGILKPKLTLEACLQQTGIKGVPGKHNAVSDAQNTYILWHKAMEAGIDYLPLIKRIPANIFEEDVSSDDID